MSIKAQILAREIKSLLDLLLVADNEEDRITIHGVIRLKLDMIRELLDAKSE